VYRHGDYEDYDQNLAEFFFSSNVIKPTGSDKRCMTYVTSSEVLVTCPLHVVMSAMISM
jgi:hypothetical protein